MITIPGKIPIRIHPYFWMVIFLIGWLSTESVSMTLLWAFVIFWSVLIHEFGHALTAIFFGQRAKIDLVAMGGLTQRSGPPLKLWQEFFVVLNGPLAGFSLFIIATLLMQKLHVHHASLFGKGLGIAAYINLIWTLFNLIPIQPMDGGRLLSIVMESFFGSKGIKIALFFSMVLAGILAALAFYFNNTFIGVVLFIFMYESYRNWQESLALTDHDKKTDLQLLFKDANRDLELGHDQEALEKFDQILKATGSGLLYTSAVERIAEILAQQGRTQEALDLLRPIEKNLTPEALLLFHRLLYQVGDFKKAVEVGKKAYQLKPNYQTAFLNALSNARLGEVKPAVGWLQGAVREGLPNLKEVIKMPDFDSIRNDPQFRALATKE